MMSEGDDRFDDGGHAGSFVMGLLAGTVLGAGIGMLFAPKPRPDLRDQIADPAGQLGAASEPDKKATDPAA